MAHKEVILNLDLVAEPATHGPGEPNAKAGNALSHRHHKREKNECAAD
jgi:hypothetical protein